LPRDRSSCTRWIVTKMSDPSWEHDAIGLLSELIRNACVNTGEPESGQEIRSVATVQRFVGDGGVVIEPFPGRASVVYRIQGSDPAAPSLLMIPHLDVVPADEDGWEHPPFSGNSVDGYIWGRGAVDMLNVTAAMAVTFKALRDGVLRRPTGDIVLAAVADEEAGGVYGAEHLIEHEWDLIACDYVLTEVAGPALHNEQGTSIPVTVAEKGPAWRSFSAAGIPGHGSQPYGADNAVVTIASAFHRIAESPMPVLITDEWREFVPHLPVDPDIRASLTVPDQVDNAVATIAESDPTLARWIHACTHLTLSPNVVTGGTKANVVPKHSSGDVDVRLLPGQDASDLDDHLRKILGPDLYDRLEITPVLEMAANSSPASGPLWEAIADAAEKHVGSRSLAPTLTPVTTDARFFRERGIPSYGVGLFDDSVTFAEMLGMFHGDNERISERSVVNTTRFLSTVIERFSERIAHQ
jgi:acetylornithine deacetylase/succinyl-diaminopimelate desuccinylase-like protein